jgi:ankyrin repeat protein
VHETKTLEMLDAAENGDIEKIHSLLAEDPRLANAVGEYHKTPLHWAAEKNHGEVARVLIDAGADLNRVTTWGASPLEWAAYMGSEEVADQLLARGATGMNLVLAAGLGRLDEVMDYCDSRSSLDGLGIPKRPNDVNDSKGWPPDAARMKGDALGEAFQLACRNGHLEVAKYLLGRGADVDAKGYFGGTGLHWAAINGHADVVDWLLDNGADTEIVDNGFKATPTGWAVEGGHDDIAIMIRDRRGPPGLQIER